MWTLTKSLAVRVRLSPVYCHDEIRTNNLMHTANLIKALTCTYQTENRIPLYTTH